VGQKLLPWPWGGRAKVQSKTATKRERQGTSTRKDLRVLCYEHHSEMRLECRTEPAETFLYACREPGCFIHYSGSQGYFIEPTMGTGANRKSSLASIVRSMGALCTSRRCGPKKRASAYGNARNVTRSILMGRFQVRQPLPANAVPAVFGQVL